MKKLILLVITVVGVAFAFDGYAQSTGINPSIGAVHYYKVNDVGDTYAWKLTKASDTATDLLGSVAIVTAGTELTDSLELTWVNPEVDTIYILSVVVTDAEGCTNQKNIAIQPINSFEIFAYNVLADGTLMTGTDSLDYSECAPVVTVVGWNGTDPVTSGNANDFTYNYGQVQLYYKVEAEGIDFETTTWEPAMTITKEFGAGSVVAIDTLLGGVPGARTWKNVEGWQPNVEFKPEIPAGTYNDVLWVRLTVDNGTVNENLTNDNSYTYNLSLGDTGNSEDGNGNKTTNTQDTAPVQTQKARPDTGDIITN